MTRSDMATQGTDAAALAEIKKVSEDAQRLAKGDQPEGADHVRVLAGLVHQLAEHTERALRMKTGAATSTPDPVSGVAAHPADAGPLLSSSANHDREVALEEDQSPQDAPAEPINDRTSAHTADAPPTR